DCQLLSTSTHRWLLKLARNAVKSTSAADRSAANVSVVNLLNTPAAMASCSSSGVSSALVLILTSASAAQLRQCSSVARHSGRYARYRAACALPVSSRLRLRSDARFTCKSGRPGCRQLTPGPGRAGPPESLSSAVAHEASLMS